MQEAKALPSLDDISIEQFDKLLEYIESKTGMIFEPRLYEWVKKQTVETFKRADSSNFQAFMKLLILGSNQKDADTLFDLLTINETMFFRDKQYFKFLNELCLPKIFENNAATKRASFLMAGGSTGQEIYSILFTILENFPEFKAWNLDFYSFDLCRDAITKGKNGIYLNHEIKRGLQEKDDLLNRYFNKISDTEWQIKDQIRSKVTFRTANLVESFFTFPKVDFISCRNVLIYFDLETKKDIIKRLSEKVNKDGYLVLGQVDYLNAKEPPDQFSFTMWKNFPYFRRSKD